MSLTIFMWYAQYVYRFTLKKILTLEININIENEILFLHTENSRQHPIHVNASHYEVGISIRRQFSLSIRYREWIISSRPIECPKYTVGSLRKILQLVYFQKTFFVCVAFYYLMVCDFKTVLNSGTLLWSLHVIAWKKRTWKNSYYLSFVLFPKNEYTNIHKIMIKLVPFFLPLTVTSIDPK